jgi:hypothetical protein
MYRNIYGTKELDSFPEEHLGRVEKYSDDGGDEVSELCKDRGFPKDVLICGVNRCFCVWSTAVGLRERHDHPVILLPAAVGCWDGCRFCSTPDGYEERLNYYVERGVVVQKN